MVLRGLTDLFRDGLVFKGGTSLSKVHTAFFRLSEDLDFSVSITPDASRGSRRKASEPFKDHFAGIPTRDACFSVADPFQGFAGSRQYNGRLAYRSAVTGEDEFVKVEVGYREKVLLPAVDLSARTLLVDPGTNAPVIPPFSVRVLALREAYAEKVRAALTRRETAIRDFFDVCHAIQASLLCHLDSDFLSLVIEKLEIAEEPVDTSPAKVEIVRLQLEAQLKPVLRTSDYEAFLLDRAIELLREIAGRCRKG